ncbi:hypothetical protein VP01_2055g1 [Puccinia sorghi]|uniref:phospholipase D n=1 Tax=Puccinia sorghi TaxID=27349 RepID=A0A0L6VAR2_9BASI|nr:hypothetical protein VP01_2055g1 [Puccinia sorghi]
MAAAVVSQQPRSPIQRGDCTDGRSVVLTNKHKINSKDSEVGSRGFSSQTVRSPIHPPVFNNIAHHACCDLMYLSFPFLARHDDPEEKLRDEKLEAIRARHRFQSFAKEREGNLVKWYVDGHDYFYAVSELLDSARSCIFIQDWWSVESRALFASSTRSERTMEARSHLETKSRDRCQNLRHCLQRLTFSSSSAYLLELSHTELCPSFSRLAHLEVSVSNTMNSLHTKHALEGLHPNIACMRHPDHFDGEDTVLFWVITSSKSHCRGQQYGVYRWSRPVLRSLGYILAFFGRLPYRGLEEDSLARYREVIFDENPGSRMACQDYNNARVQDFQNVEKWASNQQSRLEVPRMPWHDVTATCFSQVHMMIQGPTVFDICQHFVERWNFIYNLKYKKKRGTDGRYELLAFPHVLGQEMPDHPSHPDHEPVTQHPHYQQWAQTGRRFLGMEANPQISTQSPSTNLDPKGNMKVQVVRSCGDWSNGTTTEHSIQNAYIQLIEQAQRFIYMSVASPPDFITTCSTDKDGQIRNTIGLALANRIVQAARANQPFKIVVAIPCIPGFSGNLDDSDQSDGTMAIMDWTYKSICRGPGSIFSHVQSHGVDPRKYISFYNLRSFDRIDYDPETLKKIEDAAGISYYEAEAALARTYLGESAGSEELEKNKEVTFKLAQKGESMQAGNRDLMACDGETLKIDLPRNVEEARHRLSTWSEAASRYHRGGPTSITTKNNSSGLEALPWLGNEQSERNAFVTEELYIHTKCMIVDDQKVIMGSANINDRSMIKTLSIVPWLAKTCWKASRFAATLRRRLYREHLGLFSPQSNSLQSNEPTRSMLPVNVPQEDVMGSREDQIVTDPMGRELEEMWTGRARVNTQAFNKVFRCVPAAGILNWKDYEEYVPNGPDAPKVGHVAPSAGDVHEVKRELSRIQGQLVEMPLDFLEQDKMYREGKAVNLVTMNIYT